MGTQERQERMDATDRRAETVTQADGLLPLAALKCDRLRSTQQDDQALWTAAGFSALHSIRIKHIGWHFIVAATHIVAPLLQLVADHLLVGAVVGHDTQAGAPQCQLTLPVLQQRCRCNHKVRAPAHHTTHATETDMPAVPLHMQLSNFNRA